ncbi:MAG TPA: polymer-forming cytoskeletal protein, partial [Candidatus Bipolaricaulis anaerobius]|nr:polymer-forming cytoskeletal protein [Candidatus Bipolaricaulis anaerobius]
MSTPLPEVTPGDASVYIVPGMITAGGTRVAEWAPFEAGPWSDIPGPWQDGYVLHTGLTNGLEYCYRIQFTAPGGARTAWSEPRCVVPNADPTPPRLEMIEGITYCSETSGWPLLRFYDQPFVSDYSVPRVDLGVSTSGVTEMRIWPGAGEAPEGTPWQFAVEEPAIPLVDGYTVYSVQVRDGAGNVSGVVLLPVRCTEQVCDYEPAAIGCCTSVTDCEGMADYALFASNSLRIADATVIGTPDPDVHAPIASAGTSEVNLGVEAVTGSLWTAGSLVVRDRGRVEGDAFAAGPIQLMNGASVTGERWQNADFLRFPPLSSFTVTFPSPPGPNVTVPPDSTRILAPGSYGALNIGSRTKVYLKTGTYYFTS